MPADWRPPDSRPLASRPLQVPGTILEITYDAASRGADVQFLSCYPRERELLLPPFCMFSTTDVEQRGYKRFIKCSLTVNPGSFDLGISKFTDVPPRLSGMPGGRMRRDTNEMADEMITHILRKQHPEFFDPFTTAIFKDPVTAEDGLVYERMHIERWIRERHDAQLPWPPFEARRTEAA